MAGIIAGNDPSTAARAPASSRASRPDARLTSLKVAHDRRRGRRLAGHRRRSTGWSQHRNDDPSNPIRVLNLSYGTDGVQDYRLDPLAHAVENAWRAGIVVVVAGGNNGTRQPHAEQPGVRPVRARRRRRRHQGTGRRLRRRRARRSAAAATPAAGSTSSRPDGRISRLRVPGLLHRRGAPGRAGSASRYFKGSGTSQAAAVVSGAVALLLQSRPSLTPGPGQGAAARLGRGRCPAPTPPAGARASSTSTGASTPRRAADHADLAARRPGSARWRRRAARTHVADDGVELHRRAGTSSAPFDAGAAGPRPARASRLERRRLGRQRLDRRLLVRHVWSGRVLGRAGPGPAESWSGKSWAGTSWAGQVVVRQVVGRQDLVRHGHGPAGTGSASPGRRAGRPE